MSTRVTYVLPFRSTGVPSDEFVTYVNALSESAEVVLVDASPEPVYREVGKRLAPHVRHVPPHHQHGNLKNGKVRGVLTGLQLATHDAVVIADDDVRYEKEGLNRVVDALREADIVRPQNFFAPLPWHARIDTARMLINRVTGGDWPGTLALKKAALDGTGGYDGDVLFENLELVRTVIAAGGTAITLRDLFIRRLPPRTSHFWSQRVRQAYDEFARPARLVVALAVLPIAAGLGWYGWWWTLTLLVVALPIVAAEWGRSIGGARRVFPFSAALCAPFWVAERACCVWVAVAMRLALGGVPYHGHLLRKAANPVRILRAQLSARAVHFGSPSSRPG